MTAVASVRWPAAARPPNSSGPNQPPDGRFDPAAHDAGAGHRAWRAIGTSVHVLVTEPGLADVAATAVAGVLDAVDACYSRFRDDSELRCLGAHPGVPAPVSPLLGRAIDAALRAARMTDGAVDPTVGRAMRLLGYDEDFDRVRGIRGPLAVHLAAVSGWQMVRYDRVSRTLTVPRGVELDLGSTGKALAADLAAEAALAAMGRGGVLVSLGGDMATAGPAPAGGWRVLAAEDSDAAPDGPGEVVALHAGALATSSTTVRRWLRGTVALHHLVDPATGHPAASPWRTVSVAATTCVDANLAATAAIVKGAAGLEWLRSLDVPARLVSIAGEVVRLGGWPESSAPTPVVRT